VKFNVYDYEPLVLQFATRVIRNCRSQMNIVYYRQKTIVKDLFQVKIKICKIEWLPTTAG